MSQVDEEETSSSWSDVSSSGYPYDEEMFAGCCKWCRMERYEKLLAFDQEIGEKMEVLDEIDRDTLQLKSEMRLAVYDLERSFQEKHETLFKKRMEVINGLNEPNKIAIKFWSSVLEYLPKLDCMVITRYDKAVLFHLIDIRVSALLPPNYGQKFEFHFEPNQFLKSTFLTKTYLKKLDDFHNFEIYESFGCEIKWKKGMNIIGMNDKLNPETPFFKADTFFNFFAPPKAQKPSDQLVDKYLLNDYKACGLIEFAIYHALSVFKGEGPQAT